MYSDEKIPGCLYCGFPGLNRFKNKDLLELQQRKFHAIDISYTKYHIDINQLKYLIELLNINTIFLPDLFAEYYIELDKLPDTISGSQVTNIQGIAASEELKLILQQNLINKKNIFIVNGGKLAAINLPEEIIEYIIHYITDNSEKIALTRSAARHMRKKLLA